MGWGKGGFGGFGARDAPVAMDGAVRWTAVGAGGRRASAAHF